MVSIIQYFQSGQQNPFLKDFTDRIEELRYRYYASELLVQLLHSPDFDLNEAVRKAMALCKLSGIRVQDHFTAVYRSEFGGLARDWKLSELACGFVIISLNAGNDEARDIQEAFIHYLGL